MVGNNGSSSLGMHVSLKSSPRLRDGIRTYTDIWGGGWHRRGTPYTAPHDDMYVPVAPFPEGATPEKELQVLRERVSYYGKVLHGMERRISELERRSGQS